MESIQNTFRGFFDAVHEINEKYKEPRIKMTRGVALALLILRIYVLFTVAILLLKFIQLAMSGQLGGVP